MKKPQPELFASPANPSTTDCDVRVGTLHTVSIGMGKLRESIIVRILGFGILPSGDPVALCDHRRTGHVLEIPLAIFQAGRKTVPELCPISND